MRWLGLLEKEAPSGLENTACGRGNSKRPHLGWTGMRETEPIVSGRGENRVTGSLCSVQAMVRDGDLPHTEIYKFTSS